MTTAAGRCAVGRGGVRAVLPQAEWDLPAGVPAAAGQPGPAGGREQPSTAYAGRTPTRATSWLALPPTSSSTRKRGQILPVDLSAEPEIRDLLSAMDTTDPAAEN